MLGNQSESEILFAQEQLMSARVLKTVDKGVVIDFETKQVEFKNTVYAIQQIINSYCTANLRKLYRVVSASLEAYFKKRWSVSRAQVSSVIMKVYRLYEAGAVLRHLEGAKTLPWKERICRLLKNAAGVNPDLLSLWNQVLEKTGSNEILISTFNIEDFWTKQGHNMDLAKPAKAARKQTRKVKGSRKFVDSETDDSEDEDQHVHKRSMSLDGRGEDKPFQRTESYREWSSDDSLGLEMDWISCQESMQKIQAKGYVIEALQNGAWVRPMDFKLTPISNDNNVYNLFEHLLLAANLASNEF